MSDLVNRLSTRHDQFSGTSPGEDEQLMSEAAKRIEELETAIREHREAYRTRSVGMVYEHALVTERLWRVLEETP